MANLDRIKCTDCYKVEENAHNAEGRSHGNRYFSKLQTETYRKYHRRLQHILSHHQRRPLSFPISVVCSTFSAYFSKAFSTASLSIPLAFRCRMTLMGVLLPVWLLPSNIFSGLGLSMFCASPPKTLSDIIRWFSTGGRFFFSDFRILSLNPRVSPGNWFWATRCFPSSARRHSSADRTLVLSWGDSAIFLTLAQVKSSAKFL